MNTFLYGKADKALYLKVLFLVLPLFGLLLYKYYSTEISISDTNVHFYTAYKMLQGKGLYKDLIFTNLPLFPIISIFYFILTKGNIYLFYFTGAIEAFILAILVYYATYFHTRRYLPSLLSSLIFAFSVYNLANSGSQAGIYTASIFLVASYIFILKKRPFLAGLFISLCFLTKAYFIPILVALSFLSMVSFNKRQIFKWIGGLIMGLIPLVPFLFTSAPEMYRYLFGFSLQRGTGIDKFAELKTFLTFDFIFPLLLPLMLLYKKANRTFWIFLFVLFLAFFLYFSDFYYFYFGMIVPFLAIRVGHLSSYAFSRMKNDNTKILVLILFSALIFFATATPLLL